MNSFVTIIFLGARVVLASVIGLAIQILLLVRDSDSLLVIQENMKDLASYVFSSFDMNSQYHVGYNLIGGDNIIVHTFFVLIAYIAILILLLPFRRKAPRERRIFR